MSEMTTENAQTCNCDYWHNEHRWHCATNYPSTEGDYTHEAREDDGHGRSSTPVGVGDSDPLRAGCLPRSGHARPDDVGSDSHGRRRPVQGDLPDLRGGEQGSRPLRLTEHRQAPENPDDGDSLSCPCGAAFEFVVLPDGLPGEWVLADNPSSPAMTTIASEDR